jgi:hypothetical protein
MVHKDIVTFLLFDKAITLFVTKPFYNSVWQDVVLLSLNINRIMTMSSARISWERCIAEA